MARIKRLAYLVIIWNSCCSCWSRISKHPGAKKILCIETNKIYDCVREAEIETGINAHHIGQVANNKYGRKTAGGYHWQWA